MVSSVEKAARLQKRSTIAGLLVVGLVAGCTQASNLNQGGLKPATPLNPAPLTPVQSGNLEPTPPPPTGENLAGSQTAAGETPTDDQSQQVAAVTGPKDNTPVTRQTMVGAWTVSTGGTNCQIFLALTKWSGGYRAAPRGCSASISDVQAWDVKNNRVVLVSSSGSQAASLSRSAAERFDGSTSSGSAITFSR